MNGVENGISAVKGLEGRLSSGRMGSIVVGEFCHWEPFAPVILLITDEHSKILFEDLINPFSLAIRFWMVGC